MKTVHSRLNEHGVLESHMHKVTRYLAVPRIHSLTAVCHAVILALLLGNLNVKAIGAAIPEAREMPGNERSRESDEKSGKEAAEGAGTAEEGRPEALNEDHVYEVLRSPEAKVSAAIEQNEAVRQAREDFARALDEVKFSMMFEDAHKPAKLLTTELMPEEGGLFRLATRFEIGGKRVRLEFFAASKKILNALSEFITHLFANKQDGVTLNVVVRKARKDLQERFGMDATSVTIRYVDEFEHTHVVELPDPSGDEFSDLHIVEDPPIGTTASSRVEARTPTYD